MSPFYSILLSFINVKKGFSLTTEIIKRKGGVG